MIPLVFYLTQLLIDLAATQFADKIGYRTCVVASQVLSAVGLVLMAILPEVLPIPFIGILISVVLYAMGSGLIEVLVSPAMVGSLSEMAGGNLKTGLFAATLFPIVLVFGLLILKKKVSKATNRES